MIAMYIVSPSQTERKEGDDTRLETSGIVPGKGGRSRYAD